MKSISAQHGNWRQGLAASCDSLVHPAVTDAGERTLHGRLLGLLFALPLYAGILLVQTLYEHLPATMLVAILCAAFAAGWLAAAAVAAVRNTRLAIRVSLGALTGLVGLAVGATGTFSSPLFFLLLAPAFELWWLGGRPLQHGTLLSCLALLIAVASQPLVAVAGFSADLWLLPVCYGAAIWLRLPEAAPAEAPVREREDLADIARISGATVVRLDRRGHVEAMHGQLAEWLGVEPAALLGSGLFDRLHVTDRLVYLSALDTARTDGGSAEIRLRLRGASDGEGKAGGFRLIGLVATLAQDGACIACIRDCAGIEALEARVEHAERRVARLEQSKGQFLAAVSHELRTPLNAIVGFADMLGHEIAGPLPDPRQKDYVRLIGESGQHLLAVVNAILDVSRIETGNYEIVPEPFPVAEAVELSLSIMQVEADARGVALTRRVAPTVDRLCADRRAVQQMLINLISNAVKFTPEGGRIEVVADRTDSHLVLRVCDNGIGMARADLDRIGRPFVRLHPADREQGTGLGLHLVKGLVALHEGTMEIDSAPSLGTAVTIRLPLLGPGRAGVHRLRNTNSVEEEQAERKDEAERRCA